MDRDLEYLIASTSVINHVHDIGVLDPYNSWEAYWRVMGRPPVVLSAVLDGDIPAHIEVSQPNTGPAWIEWLLWPCERGRTTRGSVAVHRLPGTGIGAVMGGGTYDRNRKASARIRRIPRPDAKWGLTSVHFERYGIGTTY